MAMTRTYPWRLVKASKRREPLAWLLGLPAWAAISAGNMAKGLVLPPEARRVIIAADPDDVGRKAARDAWIRWTAEGREVRIAIPDGAADFNDLLRARKAIHV